jgi:hypothetical protein
LLTNWAAKGGTSPTSAAQKGAEVDAAAEGGSGQQAAHCGRRHPELRRHEIRSVRLLAKQR